MHFVSRLAAALAAFFMLAAPARAERMLFLMQPFPPFVQEQGGQATGPYPDIVRRVCAAMSLDCQFQFMPWRRAQHLVETGQADGLFVILRTPDREDRYHFSVPILRTGYGLYVEQGSRFARYAGPEDLDGCTLAAYGPSGTSVVAESLAKSVPRSRAIILEIDNLTVLRKLAAGRYGPTGVAVMNTDLAAMLMRRERIGNLRLLAEVQKAEYVIGLSKQRVPRQLADQFDAQLRALIHSGAVREIAARYALTPAQ